MTEDLSPNQYFELRKETVLNLQESQGINPYPHKFHVTHSLDEFVKQFEQLESSSTLENVSCAIAGRIKNIRSFGKLVFILLNGDGVNLQVYYSNSLISFDQTCHLYRVGDIIGVNGYPGRTKSGELSIFAQESTLLSPCLHMLSAQTLTNKETRYRQRYLDLIINSESRELFLTRSKIIHELRTFLHEKNFVEVETPTLGMIIGGASARPFTTHHNEMGKELYLRISPELYLKRLVVGGLNRVFEIGKNFRNEGIDLTHNPEFTMCEFYMAFADYNDLMEITEELLSRMAMKVLGGLVTEYTKSNGETVTIDFTPPYKRYPVIETLETKIGVTIPRPYSSESTRLFLIDLCVQNGLSIDPPATAKLIDRLVSHFIEPDIISPAFITDHPQIMSPLAKYHRSDSELTERFELFVAGTELVNSYTELNNPFIQRACFEDQAKEKEHGDDEAQIIDEDFCTSLEYGLPPTAGWGMGIDRATMFFGRANSIKEVILFPAMKPKTNN